MSINPFLRGSVILSSVVRDTVNSPFPYYFNNTRKNSFLVAGTSIFLMVFLVTFEPASHYFKIPMVGGITFSILFLNIVVLPHLLPRVFDVTNWTAGKYLLFTIWQLITVGFILSYAFFQLGFHPGSTFAETFGDVLPRVLSHGFIPITIITILLRYHTLQENLRDAIRMNRELEKIELLKDDPTHEKADKITVFSDTKESLTLTISDLLYVEANENYSTLYWKGIREIEKRMLRINLKNVEKQLGNHFTLRCHRSYIVNVGAIDQVSGNANGYKLGIRNCSFSVPVSRSKGKEVIEKIEHLRNLLEIM